MRENYPVFLLMTGLYENIKKIQDEDELTFFVSSAKNRTNAIKYWWNDRIL